MIRLLTLVLLLLTSAAYAGQGMGPGPGFKTYAVSGTPLTAASFSFTSDPNGGGDSASDATGVIETVTGHTGASVSAWKVTMGFYNNDIDATDYTPGSIGQTITIPAGGKRLSFWAKGPAVNTFVSPRYDADIKLVNNGELTDYFTSGTGWELVTTDVIPAGSHTLKLLVYYPSYDPIYISDITLIAP